MWPFVRKEHAQAIQPPRRDDPIAGNNSSLLRRLPWIEAGLTALGASILYFALHKSELAEFFAIGGAIVTLGRLGYAAEMEKSITSIEDAVASLRTDVENAIASLRTPLDRIREHFDITSQVHFTVFRDMLQEYAKITEPEFSGVKDGILTDARSRLVNLAHDKKSVVLPTTTYYGWLLPMLKNAMPPESIWALSMMREPEWNDSRPERDFIDFSKAASDRGVPIERVFVIAQDAVPAALDNPSIQFHLHTAKPDNLRGYVVEEEVVKRDDEDLYLMLGDGFIAFRERVALVDVFSGKSARGYVTMNPIQISHLREIYDRLQILAEPLDTYIARRLKASTALTASGNNLLLTVGKQSTEIAAAVDVSQH